MQLFTLLDLSYALTKLSRWSSWSSINTLNSSVCSTTCYRRAEATGAAEKVTNITNARSNLRRVVPLQLVMQFIMIIVCLTFLAVDLIKT